MKLHFEDDLDYQKAAISAYLGNKSHHIPAQKMFNATGRAYPDVSACSSGFLVVSNFIPMPVAGTSCAAPTFSGVVSLLNDLRLLAGVCSEVLLFSFAKCVMLKSQVNRRSASSTLSSVSNFLF